MRPAFSGAEFPVALGALDAQINSRLKIDLQAMSGGATFQM